MSCDVIRSVIVALESKSGQGKIFIGDLARRLFQLDFLVRAI